MSTYRKQHVQAASGMGRRGFSIGGPLHALGGLAAAAVFGHVGRTVAGAFRPAQPHAPTHSAPGVSGAGQAAARPGRTAAATVQEPTVASGGGISPRKRKAGELFPAGYSSSGSVKTPMFPSGFASGGGVQESLPAGVEVVDWAKAGGAVANAGGTAAGGVGAAAGGAEAAGTAVGGLAAAVGTVTTGFGAVVAAATVVVHGLNQLSQSAIVANESFRDVSPAMAQIFAERDVRRTVRDVEKGESLAESARALVEAEQKKEDNTKDIEVLLGTVQNEVAASWEAFKAEIFKPLNAIAKAVNEMLNFGQGKKDNIPLSDWFRDVQQDAKEGTRRGAPVNRGRISGRRRDEGRADGTGGAGGDFGPQ